jgi:23S rRNA (uracil1939-C5)-methyltransferase
MIATVTIERLGTDGAGLARFDGAIVAVPGTLPGELARIEQGKRKAPARLIARLSDSPERVAAACRHFGICGGCALQHLAPEGYARFKQRLIADALSRNGITGITPEDPLVSPPGSRRRARFEVRRTAAGAVAGFHAPASGRIVDLAECPILLPELAGLLPALRRLAAVLLPVGATLGTVASASDSGIDVGLVLPAEPRLAALEALADFAEEQDLARLWWRLPQTEPIPVAVRRRPVARIGAASVELPPDGFRQATRHGETALAGLVGEAAGGAAKLADLFAGIGTFSLPLAGRAEILAVEGDRRAVAALAAAIRAAGLAGIAAERRDLDVNPLAGPELDRFDAVILDPPRAGARAQSAELARSRVPVVVSVSCDPATFARDAAILVAGGYRIERVVPIDQFLWSAHLELVAVFRRR